MSEPKHGYYLTTGPSDDRKKVIAIISDGSPQMGHEEVTVLTLETFPFGTPRAEIGRWFNRMKIEKPWEPRQ